MADQVKSGGEDTAEPHDLDTHAPAENYESSNKSGTKDKIVGKIRAEVLGKQQKNELTLPEGVRISDNIRTILMGLFVLIGFIVLVFAIFTASVSSELAQTSTSVFMAALVTAIVGAFALLGIVVYQIRDKDV